MLKCLWSIFQWAKAALFVIVLLLCWNKNNLYSHLSATANLKFCRSPSSLCLFSFQSPPSGLLPAPHFPPSSSGSSQQSHRLREQAFQIHKIHRIFHKWMNTIFYQFPHYANMQNIAFRPIRRPHSSKFNRLSHNCRNYQIITASNCEYLWQIQQILTQITFYSSSHWKPHQLSSFFFAKSNLTYIIKRIECLLSNLNNSWVCNVEWWNKLVEEPHGILQIFFTGLSICGEDVSHYYCRWHKVFHTVIEDDKRWLALLTMPRSFMWTEAHSRNTFCWNEPFNNNLIKHFVTKPFFLLFLYFAVINC